VHRSSSVPSLVFHCFVGSGVIEAGCKPIIGSRCKQSGMFWTVRGANSILALRLLPIQRPLRGLLGSAPGGVISTFMSHTRRETA